MSIANYFWKNVYLVLLTITSSLLLGCQKQKSDGFEEGLLQKKIDSLTNVVKGLQGELDGYRNSPEKLCANIEQLFHEKKEADLKDIATKLRKYHPESAELVKVEGYIKTIDEIRTKEAEKIREERMKAVNILKKKYDDVNGITWYQSRHVTHNVWSNKASIYIGKDNSSVWLRLKMSYYGEDWIFFDDAYLSYEGDTYSVTFDRYRDKKTENEGGMVWEWIDVNVDEHLLVYLRKFVKGSSPKMRLSGKYTHTRNLTPNEITAMKEVLLAYDVLKRGV